MDEEEYRKEIEEQLDGLSLKVRQVALLYLIQVLENEELSIGVEDLTRTQHLNGNEIEEWNDWLENNKPQCNIKEGNGIELAKLLQKSRMYGNGRNQKRT